MQYLIKGKSTFKSCCSELNPCAVEILLKTIIENELGVFGQLGWALGVLVMHCPRPGCQLPALGSVGFLPSTLYLQKKAWNHSDMKLRRKRSIKEEKKGTVAVSKFRDLM